MSHARKHGAPGVYNIYTIINCHANNSTKYKHSGVRVCTAIALKVVGPVTLMWIDCVQDSGNNNDDWQTLVSLAVM